MWQIKIFSHLTIFIFWLKIIKHFLEFWKHMDKFKVVPMVAVN